MNLNDILNGGGTWDATQAAGESEPLPPGEYAATVIKGGMSENRHGTPRYTLTFKVDDGPHTGRLFWHECYLTPSALPYAKRDLMKFGVRGPADLERPLPARFRCKVRLVKRRGDDGREWNRVERFDVLARVEVEPDPYAPAEGGAA